ncbi:NUDIX hydrolase [Risungbinella massiliensis]|uniref:NUDIX hydrolase n=1 Tax=Risungbinella massiliensis TaxID=1329796 RepID=UPI0005CBEDFA|nr:hypothetical protein [Risungbinella massiliensis]
MHLYPLHFPVRAFHSGTKVDLPFKLQADITSYWEEAKLTIPHMTNGTIYHVSKFTLPTATKPTFTFELQETKYEHYLYSRRKLSEDSPYYCRTLFASCIMVTTDDHFVFGDLGEESFRPGYLQPVGGSLDQADGDGMEFQLEKTIQREVLEEIGINLQDSNLTRTIEPAYLKQNGNFGIIYRIELNWTSKEVLQNFQHKQQLGEIDEEFQTILTVPRNEIRRFLEQDTRRRVDHLHLLLQEA